MIPNKNTAVTVQGNMDNFKSVSMGIAKGAEAHIITLLTDLYGDQIMAVIREYATNARDAQIEAGVTGPIKVSLPTHLSPLYTVADAGIGLDRDEIERVYSQYGASTKRTSNEVNGMMGLGCKSALTYTNQFTIVSVKDNIRTTAIVSRVDDDLPTMTVVDESRVVAPNGTEVQVPVQRHDMRLFEQKAAAFFSYWDDGQVLVNGQEPKKLSGLAVGDDMLIVPDHQLTEHRVVMGGVSYPIPGDSIASLQLPYGSSLVARIPIGSVDIAPSRENLMSTSATKATLNAVRTSFLAAAEKAVQAEVDKAPSHFDALQVVLKWAKLVPGVKREDLTYKGAAIPTSYGSEGVEIIQVPGPHAGSKLSAHNKARFVNAEVFDSTIFVYGYDRASFTAGQKKKLNKWVEDRRTAAYSAGKTFTMPRHFVLLGDKPDSPYIPSENIIDWPTIQAIKLPRASGGVSGRIPGSYDFYEGTTYREGVEDTEIDEDNPIYYLVGRQHSGWAYAAILATDSSDFTLVVLQERRVGKFLRNFPEAVKVDTVVNKLWDKVVAGISTEQKLALAVRQHGPGNLSRLDASKVDDPAVKEAIRLLGVNVDATQKALNTFRYVTVKDLSLPTFVNPLNKYPLTESYQAWRYMDHLYLYMNAVYAAQSAA